MGNTVDWFFQNVFIGYLDSMCTGFECTLSSSRCQLEPALPSEFGLASQKHFLPGEYWACGLSPTPLQQQRETLLFPHRVFHHTHRYRSLADPVFCVPLLFVYGGKVSATKFLLWYLGGEVWTQDLCWICCSVWDCRWIQAKPVSSTSVAGNSVAGGSWTFFAQRLVLRG